MTPREPTPAEQILQQISQAKREAQTRRALHEKRSLLRSLTRRANKGGRRRRKELATMLLKQRNQ